MEKNTTERVPERVPMDRFENAIREIGNVTGSYGRPITLYEIVDNPPPVLKSYNKSFPKTFSLDLVLTEDGNIDTEKIVENLDLYLSNISRKFDISY